MWETKRRLDDYDDAWCSSINNHTKHKDIHIL